MGVGDLPASDQEQVDLDELFRFLIFHMRRPEIPYSHHGQLRRQRRDTDLGRQQQQQAQKQQGRRPRGYKQLGSYHHHGHY